MNTKKEVSIKKISQDAEDLFRGGFFCSEALISSIRSNFEVHPVTIHFQDSTHSCYYS